MLQAVANASSSPLIKIAIPSVEVLSACYMPFLQHKGFFVPSAHLRELGKPVFLVLRLGLGETFVAGRATICWITPVQSSDGRMSGFGLHFDAGSSELADAIEAYLATNGHSIRTRTHTL